MPLAPVGFNVIAPLYLNMSSNFNLQQDILIEGGDVRSEVVPVSLIRFFRIKDRFAQVWVTPMWGTVSGSVSNEALTLDLPRVSGFTDPYVAARVGLIGAPALQLDSFIHHVPGFQLYGLIGANIPVGDYQQNRPVNLGTNRWAIRVAAPMVMPFATGHPARPWVLEFTPSLMLYSTNSAPYGATERTQDPQFIAEAHFSRNFTKKFWAGVDLRAQQGGETHTDGNDDDNRISQLGGGATIGYQVLAPLGIYVGYGSVWLSDKSEGEMFRTRVTMMF
jgi:hypothetical protein